MKIKKKRSARSSIDSPGSTSKDPGIQRREAPDPVGLLAADIDRFAFDFDPYEYRDQVEDREAAVRELTVSIRHGDVRGIQDWLQDILDENEPGEDTAKAADLKQRLRRLLPA